jgi:hypothetical protein
MELDLSAQLVCSPSPAKTSHREGDSNNINTSRTLQGTANTITLAASIEQDVTVLKSSPSVLTSVPLVRLGQRRR